MANIKFYIFGIPDGFDIYQESPDADIKNYYQCFYDESIKENTRLAIHRKLNDGVSYTFLKYHLYSSESRPNAFFGLSVLFEKGYYADVSSLFNLLDYVYNDIVKKGIILEHSTNGDSIKFVPQKFSMVSTEVKNIESYIINTLYSTEYSTEFHALNNTFGTGKQNAMLKIPFQVYENTDKEKELNQLVIEKLKNYSWLSLSPDYIVSKSPIAASNTSPRTNPIEEVLDPTTKRGFINNFELYQGKVLAAYKQQHSGVDINVGNLLREVQEIVFTIKNYLDREKDLTEIYGKYLGLAKDLNDLSSNMPVKSSGPKLPTAQKPDGNDTQEPHIPSRLQDNFRLYVAIALCSLSVACIVLFLILHNKPSEVHGSYDSDNDKAVLASIPDNGTSNPKPDINDLVVKFNDNFSNKHFEDAAQNYNDVVEQYGTDGRNKADNFNIRIETEFDKIIEQRDFHEAYEFYKIFESCSNASGLKEKLISSVKSYIQNNKSNIGLKDKLLSIIQDAVNYGYGYKGIDSDKNNIRNLESKDLKKASDIRQYTLLVNDGKSTEEINTEMVDNVAVAKINLLIKKQYKISVKDGPKDGEFRFFKNDFTDKTIKYNEAGDILYPQHEIMTINARNVKYSNKTIGARYCKQNKPEEIYIHIDITFNKPN